MVKVDRVEWRSIPDHQTAINALLAGEIDFMESPPHDLYPVLKQDANVRLFVANPLGNQYTFRFNMLHKPFDNAKIRQAVFYAFNQEDFLKGVIGDPQYYKTCLSFFPCGSPLYTPKGMEGLLQSNFKKSQELLKEAGYDGTPIVLMHSTDLAVLNNLAPVAKSLLEKGGFKVDMQSMDWQTLVARRAKKDPPTAGGWNAFLTSWVSADILNPVMTGFMNASLRQGAVRLAVRQGHRRPARRLRPRDEPGQAEADRRAGPGEGDAVPDPPPARPVVQPPGPCVRT